MACRTESYPATDRGTRTLDVAGTQWVHATEYRGEYNVPLQAAVRGTTPGSGLGDSTRRSDDEMRSAQSDNALGHASDRARGMNESLKRVDYL